MPTVISIIAGYAITPGMSIRTPNWSTNPNEAAMGHLGTGLGRMASIVLLSECAEGREIPIAHTTPRTSQLDKPAP